MRFLSGCFLFFDGALALIFFKLFQWIGFDTVAFVGAGIIAIPIWIWLIRIAIKEEKESKYEEERERERKAYEEECERKRKEIERKRQRETNRRNSICLFQDGISRTEFEYMAIKVAKHIKRLHVAVDGPIISCKVDSQSGISTWKFIIDFNDFGHITGSSWITLRDNYDSNIPNRYADLMQEAIQEKLKEL